MSDTFWRRLSYFSGLISIGILFGVVALTAHLEIRDLDLWLHLGVGKFIVQNSFVPTVDILSYMIEGRPWTNHEWLFQILVYFVHSLGGFEGLIRMQVAVVWFTMVLLLLLGYNRDKQFIVTFSLLLVLLIYMTRFTIRPDIFSLLFFTLYIYVLSIHIDKRWALFFLFFVQVLWTNMHGFFFFGPVFVLIALSAEWLKRHVKLPYEWNKTGRLTNEEYAHLKRILLAVILACLVNPLAWKGAWYPIEISLQLSGKSRIFFDYIQELQKPILKNNVFALENLPFYKLMIVISAYSFLFNRRRIDLGALLFWLVFLGFSLAAVRNLVFFAFAAYLVIVTNALTISLNDLLPMRFVHKKFQYITATLLKVVLALWMVNFGMMMGAGRTFDFDKLEMKSDLEGISLKNFPNKAVDFLVDNNVRGNILNDFNSGAYLVGRCYPNIKVFIDGRTEVYGADYFKNIYQRIWHQGDMAFFEQISADRGVTIVLLNTIGQPVPAKIVEYFYKSQEWVPVYFNYDGFIFVKRSPEHQKLINRFALDLAQWQATPFDLYKLGARRVSAYQYTFRAFSLESLGLDDAALTEVEQAFKIDPASIEARKILGKIHGKRGEFQKAFENFRIAASFDPGNKELKFNMAQAYFDLGEYAYAIKQYQSLIQADPKEGKAYFLLARVYARDGQYDKAEETITKAHALNPANLNDLLVIGDIFYEQDQFAGAQKIYQLGMSTNKELEKVHNKIGISYKALGEKEKARAAFQAGLEIAPDNEDLKKNLKSLRK
ncbi:MAG: hypothetical protein A3D10_00860 [Omnitrophica WOR_2 bacterium RIFCSPHIGHO2_02_FULL_48_11]|nr:MAG: hypothetical protein A3D10_00860 [Omnitrophica WOR_2 bacterium RIFCSPHIGHO2_02_FULL_48_11]